MTKKLSDIRARALKKTIGPHDNQIMGDQLQEQTHPTNLVTPEPKMTAFKATHPNSLRGIKNRLARKAQEINNNQTTNSYTPYGAPIAGNPDIDFVHQDATEQNVATLESMGMDNVPTEPGSGGVFAPNAFPGKHPDDEIAWWKDVDKASKRRPNAKAPARNWLETQTENPKAYNDKTVAGMRERAKKMGLMKALPRSKDENEARIADHQVLQDKLQEEGTPRRHTNADMAMAGSDIIRKDPTKIAQAINNNVDLREGDIDAHEPYGWSGHSPRADDEYWSETARIAGVTPSPRSALPGDPNWKKSNRLQNKQSKFHEKSKNIFPHPNAYEWHEGHTDHHPEPKDPSGVDFNVDTAKEKAKQLIPGYENVKQDLTKADSVAAKPAAIAHPHMDQPPKAVPQNEKPINDQAAGVGVSTYAKFAAPYGHLAPGTKTDLLHYPYGGKLPEIQKMVTDHGYRTYFAGGQYGKPDLTHKNYNTGHLMVYDPTPASGGDFGDHEYTNGWRQIHELSHALTYPELNKTYGEGRRIGKLGVHRSLNEAMRAVHWEWLAAHKQRDLSKQIGVHVPDDVFHKELNTVMHDAVHRAITGQFTEPSQEGYIPAAHKVPLSTAMDMLREHAQSIGLTSAHQTLKKREIERHDAREKLVKALPSRAESTKNHAAHRMFPEAAMDAGAKYEEPSEKDVAGELGDKDRDTIHTNDDGVFNRIEEARLANPVDGRYLTNVATPAAYPAASDWPGLGFGGHDDHPEHSMVTAHANDRKYWSEVDRSAQHESAPDKWPDPGSADVQQHYHPHSVTMMRERAKKIPGYDKVTQNTAKSERNVISTKRK